MLEHLAFGIAVHALDLVGEHTAGNGDAAAFLAQKTVHRNAEKGREIEQLRDFGKAQTALPFADGLAADKQFLRHFVLRQPAFLPEFSQIGRQTDFFGTFSHGSAPPFLSFYFTPFFQKINRLFRPTFQKNCLFLYET